MLYIHELFVSDAATNSLLTPNRLWNSPPQVGCWHQQLARANIFYP